MRKDLYQTLGLDPEAGEEDIKRAFRRIALNCHPDRNIENPEAEERFKEANNAYSILGDAEKRKRYNLYREFQTRSVRWGFVPPHSPVYDKVVEDFFLNATFPGFAAGFPWSFKAVAQLHPLFSFSRTSFLFLKRLMQALREEQVFRIPHKFPIFPVSSVRRHTPGTSGVSAPHASEDGQGGDIERPLPLSTEEAEKGTHLTLSFPSDSAWERVRVRVPPGVRSGVRLRVRNKGVRITEQMPQRGDLYLRVRVDG